MAMTGVERAMDVLLFIARSESPTVGITQIANSLDLPKAVVHRIVNSLRGPGFVDFDEESRRYGLGPACLTLGRAYLDKVPLRRLARAAMTRLVKATQETATLSIVEDGVRIYVDQVTPNREVLMSIRIGQPLPLYAGSSSKAYLAYLSDSEIRDYVATTELLPLTHSTLVDRSQLSDDLAITRERGYAISLGERDAHAASVAAPILDADGRPVAVMSVCGPIERFGHSVHSVGPLLLAESAELSRILGYNSTEPNSI